MGSFSWLKADTLTKVANIVYGKPFKFLIPEEFGGGFIKDRYQDYGYLGEKEDGSPKYDMYELFAFWNAETEQKYKKGFFAGNDLLYKGDEFPAMKEIDEYTDHNRGIGISIGCYDHEQKQLKYPLKLVSASYKGTYEDCKDFSRNDPCQGFYNLYRDSDEYKQHMKWVLETEEKANHVQEETVKDNLEKFYQWAEEQLEELKCKRVDVINELENDNLQPEREEELNDCYSALDAQIYSLNEQIALMDKICKEIEALEIL